MSPKCSKEFDKQACAKKVVNTFIIFFRQLLSTQHRCVIVPAPGIHTPDNALKTSSNSPASHSEFVVLSFYRYLQVFPAV